MASSTMRAKWSAPFTWLRWHDAIWRSHVHPASQTSWTVGDDWWVMHMVDYIYPVKCFGSGSGIRDPVPFWPLDPGSRISTPYFSELSDKFLGKKFYNSLKTGQNLFLQHLKNKIIFNFVKSVATKKDLTTIFFSPLSFVAVFGSGIRDPGSGMGKNQDPDPQHGC